jgi:hypothetical protein
MAKRLVRAVAVVQGGEITPIRLMSAKFSTRGIRGLDALFMFMR